MLKINEIAHIRFGLPKTSSKSGDVAYLQARHFDDQGRLHSEIDEFVEFDPKMKSHLLQEGDVLFTGKGNRLFACTYRDTKTPAIASSMFFVIRPNTNIINPEYLAVILNMPQSKNAFLKLGNGTNIFSIRIAELGAFRIPVPNLEEQKIIASLVDLHNQESEMHRKLAEQKQILMDTILTKIIEKQN